MFVWDGEFVFFPRGSGAGFENEIKKKMWKWSGKNETATSSFDKSKNIKEGFYDLGRWRGNSSIISCLFLTAK